MFARVAALLFVAGCDSNPPFAPEPLDTGGPDTPAPDATVPTVPSTQPDTSTPPPPPDDSASETETAAPPAPSLPCQVALDCGGVVVADEPKVECAVSVHDADGAVLYDGSAGVELRGRSSLGFPKPQYGIELRTPEVTVLPLGQTWRYWDRGTAPGADWAAIAYDDSQWAQGPAPLGYGDLHQVTVVSFGPDDANKYTTTWFRLSFVVVDPAALGESFHLDLVRDDGAVAYLNGAEVLRTNLPAGPILPETFADASIGGADETLPVRFEVPTSALLTGQNVLAVEVHQHSLTSSDLTLDAALVDGADEVSADFFAMGEESDWIANGQYADLTLLRNRLFFDLFRDWPRDTPAYAPQMVTCALTLDGQPRGLYTLGESIKADDDRVDIPDDAGLGTDFVLKLDDVGFHASTISYGGWKFVSPDADHVTPEQTAGADAVLLAWEAATLARTDVLAHVDLASSVDWVLLQELANNVDAWQLSIHVVKESGKPLVFVPWDFDLSSGGYPSWDCDAEGWLVTYTPRSEMVAAMADDDLWLATLQARWAELRAGPLTDDAVRARIDGLVTEMGVLPAENFTLWPMDQIVGGYGVLASLCPATDHPSAVAGLADWLVARMAWMDAHVATYREGI